MPQILVIVRDTNSNAVPYPSVTGPGGVVQGDANGIATLTVDSSFVGHTISISATAPTCSPASQNLLVTQFTATVAFNLTTTLSITSANITVSDGSTPIPNASVFIGGSFPGFGGGSSGGAGASGTYGESSTKTDSKGSTSVPIAPGSNQINVTAPGFKPYSATVDSSKVPDQIVLTPAPNSAQTLTLVSSPPGASYQIGSETGALGQDGTAQTTGSYPPGTYPVVLQAQNKSTTTSITVDPGTKVYHLTPVPVDDSGSGASLQTVATAGASAAAPTSSQPGTVSTSNAAQSSPSQGTAIQGTGSNVPNYEFVNPLGNFGRYFTATQARMYIGNLFIEELAGCQFVLQNNKVPIYGYASEAFDALGTGKSLVQGQIMVHFISEGYLFTVLNEFKKTTGQPSADALQSFQNLMATQQQLQGSNSSDPAVQQQIAAIQKQRQQLLASDPTLASAFKRTTLANSTTVVGPNAVYQNTPFDLVLELEGGGRTVTRKIFNCVLTSNEQIYGDNDSPLIDSYGFIGRRLQ